ncbi:uncharacterized protein G2W53_008204 [Senna tora]|uniref:Uncharacterized protein n=1 Tax=Senna tora TaxID=362788 RepID=A0A834X809_9FABA|nr:uncharacterized protein G2W53_008204 [Senna tora]
MEQNRKVQLLNVAIKSLTETSKNQFLESDDDDAEYQLALSRLLSELESMKGDGTLDQLEASSPSEMVASAIKKIDHENVKDGEVDDEGCMGNDEIVKELKKVRRQNFVTHCLLSVMIVLTVVWQLSEVSLVMKMKDGLSHPFRTFGSMITGMIKTPDMNNGQEGDNKEQSESHALPSLKMPEVPHMDMSNISFSNE